MGYMASVGTLMDTKEFYSWLDTCPVQWFLLDSSEDQMSVQFMVPEDDDDE